MLRMKSFRLLPAGVHNNPASYIKNIFVEESCADLPYTREILGRTKGIPVTIIPDHAAPACNDLPYPESLREGKKNLWLCKNQGKFFKPCPATREYNCCDYQVLNVGMNCPMDCVYCILQAYLNNPWLSFFVNIEDLLREVEHALASQPERFWRIGTGEFTDSMALDSLTGLSRILIEFMRDQKSAVLELKTKTALIDNLPKADHGGRTVMAWSLNSPLIMAKEEIRTASLDERLHAAACCASWGYKLAFHFDPIIFHPDWGKNYVQTISKLFQSVPKENIVWISMGALRYLPALKTLAAKRFPGSQIFYEEFVPGLDGKMRYFRTVRVAMYRRIYQELSRHVSSKTCIYLCMESDEVWREVCGSAPIDHGGLPAMLDRAVRESRA